MITPRPDAPGTPEAALALADLIATLHAWFQENEPDLIFDGYSSAAFRAMRDDLRTAYMTLCTDRPA